MRSSARKWFNYWRNWGCALGRVHAPEPCAICGGLCGAAGSFFGALRTGRFDPRRLGLLIGVLVLAIVPLILYNAYRTATG